MRVYVLSFINVISLCSFIIIYRIMLQRSTALCWKKAVVRSESENKNPQHAKYCHIKGKLIFIYHWQKFKQNWFKLVWLEFLLSIIAKKSVMCIGNIIEYGFMDRFFKFLLWNFLWRKKQMRISLIILTLQNNMEMRCYINGIWKICFIDLDIIFFIATYLTVHWLERYKLNMNSIMTFYCRIFSFCIVFCSIIC
jgi:hypothetical protein